MDHPAPGVEARGGTVAGQLPSHPGPQHVIRQSLLSSPYLGALSVVIVFFAIQAFIKDNLATDPPPPVWLWRLKLLETRDALALLIAFIGLVAARQQFVQAMRPYVVYDSDVAIGSALGLALPEENRKFWRVTARNIGSGMAIIRSADFRLLFTERDWGDFAMGYDDVQTALETHNLRGKGACSLLRLGTLGRDAETVIFEIALERAREIRALDIRYRFDGVLGDRFEKEVYCIPRGGVPAT